MCDIKITIWNLANDRFTSVLSKGKKKCNVSEGATPCCQINFKYFWKRVVYWNDHHFLRWRHFRVTWRIIITSLFLSIWRGTCNWITMCDTWPVNKNWRTVPKRPEGQCQCHVQHQLQKTKHGSIHQQPATLPYVRPTYNKYKQFFFSSLHKQNKLYG